MYTGFKYTVVKTNLLSGNEYETIWNQNSVYEKTDFDSYQKIDSWKMLTFKTLALFKYYPSAIKTSRLEVNVLFFQLNSSTTRAIKQ